MSIVKNILTLSSNLRFYIMAVSISLAILIAALLRLSIDSDRLYVIRLEQLYGLLGIGYWYLALLVSPLAFVLGKERLRLLIFSRRAIGVSAFMFSMLHAGIAFFGQLNGVKGLTFYPATYMFSLSVGLVALLVLCLLAVTSFNRVVQFMTRRRWKWLHRLTYLGGVLAVMHVWLIGTHVEYPGVRIAAAVSLLVLSGLEIYRIVIGMNMRRRTFSSTEAYVVAAVAWLVIAVLIVSLPTIFDPLRAGLNVGEIHLSMGDVV